MKGQGSLNTLKPQPGQEDYSHRSYHPLPGVWAQQQLNGTYRSAPEEHHASSSTELQRALTAEQRQHEYWENWQGVRPGKPVYEDPRAFQNTLLPVARFGTDGRGS